MYLDEEVGIQGPEGVARGERLGLEHPLRQGQRCELRAHLLQGVVFRPTWETTLTFHKHMLPGLHFPRGFGH